MSDPSLRGEPIAKRCKYCKSPLFRVRVHALGTLLSSPFSKGDPAIVCEVCDAAVQLPFQVKT